MEVCAMCVCVCVYIYSVYMHIHALHTCRTCPTNICNRRKMNNYHHLRKPRIHVEHITTQLTYSVQLVTYAKTVLLRETRRTKLLLCLSCLTEYTHGEHALYMRHGGFPIRISHHQQVWESTTIPGAEQKWWQLFEFYYIHSPSWTQLNEISDGRIHSIEKCVQNPKVMQVSLSSSEKRYTFAQMRSKSTRIF